jgi:hypothetical protein
MKNQDDNIPVIPFYNDWRLDIAITWQLKKGKYATITCPRCKGKKYDVMFDMWGEDDDKRGNPCYICHATGVIANPNIEPKPPETTAFKEAVAEFVKYYYIKNRDFLPIIKEAFKLQQNPDTRKFLYCHITDLTGFEYGDSKKLLHEYCQRGIIQCDSNFYFGKLTEIK